jgi:uncharacterized protein YcbX
MAFLTRIHIHPIKAFDPERVSEAVLLPSGGLEHDRRFALVDAHGDYIHGKRTPKMHLLRSRFDFPTGRLTLRVADTTDKHVFQVDDNRVELTAWLSDYFGMPLQIIENSSGGFPDDLELPGPTVISSATLGAVAGWFPGLSAESVRARFRANLEIGGVDEPFWEDRLLAPGLGGVRFRIGQAELLGMNPCARCIVPTRDATTAESIPQFAKIFARQREQTLPAWAPADRFDHFYRLAVNTSPTSVRSVTIREGDPVEILGAV